MQATKEKLEFAQCPFCGSTDTNYSETDGLWRCMDCWQSWEEDEII